MKQNIDILSIDFPLRGEWIAPHTPGEKIPSHGSNLLGERYAFDFLQVNHYRHIKSFYQTNILHYIVLGVPLSKCYAWGKTIYAPFDGEIVDIVSTCKERKRVHLFFDVLQILKNTRSFTKKQDFKMVAGNYIIMKYNRHIYAAFAHLQTDSICVTIGQKIKKGEALGRIGHSGNSTAPHLHFQLMDNENPLFAKGLPCVFTQYQVLQKRTWKTVYNCVPTSKEIIRYI